MTSFSFFSLPREVRDLVYTECAEFIHMEFTRRRVRLSTAATSTTWTLNVKEKVENFPEDDGTDSKPSWRPAALLNTSSQLRAEMLDYMAANNTMHVEEDPLMVHPARILKKKIPVLLRQQLRAIDLKLSAPEIGVVQIGGPFTEYFWSTEWLSDAFPALQHVTINHSESQYLSIGARPAEAEEASCATFVSSRLRLYQSAIKDLFDHYESMDLALSFRLTFHLGDHINRRLKFRWLWELQETPGIDDNIILQPKSIYDY